MGLIGIRRNKFEDKLMETAANYRKISRYDVLSINDTEKLVQLYICSLYNRNEEAVITQN